VKVGGSKIDNIPPEGPVSFLPKLLSSADLAHLYQLSEDAVDSALRRYYQDHPDCRHEVENRRQNEPRFLYRTSDVRHILEQLSRKQRLTGG
jgi:hypothetical protein